MSYDTPWQLQSLGVTPIAVQDYGKWIEQFTPEQQALVAGIPTIGSFGELNFEAVAAADPDLIVGDADEIDEATFKRLSEIAPTAIVKGYSRGDWQAITTALAEATGTTAAADTSRTAYESTLNRLRSEYADVIAANTWVHFSLGDDASQFSIQQPTGAIGNLVVNELGLLYGAGVPTDYSDGGYGSYPLEQLGTIFAGVTVALYPLNSDGSISPAIKAIQDNELFKRLEVAKSGKVFGLTTSITDFVTANEWLEELEATVLSKL
ncbi:ABC transporter substrate-binding protein [Nakamurella silvestris]|nr:ABC transporter substrate-binding protein [Nakamurella silvestris]